MNQDERLETWRLWEGARALAMLKVAVKDAPCLYNAKPHPMVLSACFLGSRVVSVGAVGRFCVTTFFLGLDTSVRNAAE